jgi:hypothetical protein
MEPRTLDPNSEQTKEKKDGRADVVGESQLVEVGSALEERVDDIGDKQGCHEREYPLAAGVVVPLESVVFTDLLGEKQGAKQIQQNGVERNEEVKRKGPLADAGEIEFPPPEVNEIEEENNTQNR